MQQRTPKFSYAQYVAMENLAEGRSEFVSGDIWAMSGTSFNHSRICSNIEAAIRNCLAAKGCEVFRESVRTVSPNRKFAGYPDLMVVCGKVLAPLDGERAVLNPCTIIEVLSETTADYDRGTKFAMYRLIPSLTEYLLIAQDEPAVEVYRKREDEWPLRAPVTDGEIEIAGCTIRIADIYQNVAW